MTDTLDSLFHKENLDEHTDIDFETYQELLGMGTTGLDLPNQVMTDGSSSHSDGFSEFGEHSSYSNGSSPPTITHISSTQIDDDSPPHGSMNFLSNNVNSTSAFMGNTQLERKNPLYDSSENLTSLNFSSSIQNTQIMDNPPYNEQLLQYHHMQSQSNNTQQHNLQTKQKRAFKPHHSSSVVGNGDPAGVFHYSPGPVSSPVPSLSNDNDNYITVYASEPMQTPNGQPIQGAFKAEEVNPFVQQLNPQQYGFPNTNPPMNNIPSGQPPAQMGLPPMAGNPNLSVSQLSSLMNAATPQQIHNLQLILAASMQQQQQQQQQQPMHNGPTNQMPHAQPNNNNNCTNNGFGFNTAPSSSNGSPIAFNPLYSAPPSSTNQISYPTFSAPNMSLPASTSNIYLNPSMSADINSVNPATVNLMNGHSVTHQGNQQMTNSPMNPLINPSVMTNFMNQQQPFGGPSNYHNGAPGMASMRASPPFLPMTPGSSYGGSNPNLSSSSGGLPSGHLQAGQLVQSNNVPEGSGKKRRLSKKHDGIKQENDLTTIISLSDSDHSSGSEDVKAIGLTQKLIFAPLLKTEWCRFLDENKNQIEYTFKIEADKGFNFSSVDEAHVCQKKNHFQISYQFSARGNAVPRYVATPTGVRPIVALLFRIAGVKMEQPPTNVTVEQSQPDRTKKIYVPQPFPPSHHFTDTVCRLHFSETTGNNIRKKGKKNPDQRYFSLNVALVAVTTAPLSEDGKEESKQEGRKECLVAMYGSPRIIVRASNPAAEGMVDRPPGSLPPTHLSVSSGPKPGLGVGMGTPTPTSIPSVPHSVNPSTPGSNPPSVPSLSNSSPYTSPSIHAPTPNPDLIQTSWKSHEGSMVYHGKVGINTDNPQEALTVNGNMRVTGGVFHPSDMRIKENIVRTSTKSQLQNIRQLPVYDYDLDDDWMEYSGRDQKHDTGFLAQEVQQVLPDAVIKSGDVSLRNGRQVDDLLIVNKERIFMENVGAVQELCKMTENLEERIRELEVLNDNMRKEAEMKKGSLERGATLARKFNSGHPPSFARLVPPAPAFPLCKVLTFVFLALLLASILAVGVVILITKNSSKASGASSEASTTTTLLTTVSLVSTTLSSIASSTALFTTTGTTTAAPLTTSGCLYGAKPGTSSCFVSASEFCTACNASYGACDANQLCACHAGWEGYLCKNVASNNSYLSKFLAQSYDPTANITMLPAFRYDAFQYTVYVASNSTDATVLVLSSDKFSPSAAWQVTKYDYLSCGDQTLLASSQDVPYAFFNTTTVAASPSTLLHITLTVQASSASITNYDIVIADNCSSVDWGHL